MRRRGSRLVNHARRAAIGHNLQPAVVSERLMANAEQQLISRNCITFDYSVSQEQHPRTRGGRVKLRSVNARADTTRQS